MSGFSDNLRALRKERGLSQAALAAALGLAKSTISMYENGQRQPEFEVEEAIADYFNVNLDYLRGRGAERLPGNIVPLPPVGTVPLIGTIACGAPILATENIEDMVPAPGCVQADFALRCRGDSMINARIFDGDLVYIHQQETVEDGEIAAVLIDDEATLKRVHLYPDHIVLEPENPQYRPLTYWEQDMSKVRILGRATYFISPVR